MRRVVRVVMVLLWTYVGTHGQAVNPDGKVLKLDATGTQRWEWLGVKDSVTNNAWALVGNSGTNPTTHFVGTTDNADLVFRTQNIERMRIDVNGRVGIGTPTPTAVLHIAEGGSDLLRVVNETTPSLEGIPIRYAARLYPQGLNGTAESAGLYGRIDPTGSHNNLVGIYGEITSAQDDGEGAFLKVVHFGKGDAIYIPLFSTGGAAYEAASFANGTTGFRATLQNPAIPKPYTVHFNALWGETTIPAYGIFYADQSPGNAFTIRKLSTALDNQTQIRLVEDNLVRERFSVFNDGSVRLSSLEADAANTVRNSPPLILRGAYWTGAASADYDWTIHNVMAGASPLASRLIIQDGGGNDRVTITNDGLVGVNTPPSFYTVDILTQTPWSGLRVRGTSHAQIAVEAPAGNAAQFTLIENGTTRYSLYLRSSTQLGIGLFDAAGNYVADALIINAPGSTGPGYSIHREGGNTRGLYAIDLQGERSDPAQVASGNYSVIAGGASNTASGNYAVLSGGFQNSASGDVSTIGGGAQNSAGGIYATVAGGELNQAGGAHASVGGGYSNQAQGTGSVIGGGSQNQVSTALGSILGGNENRVTGPRATIGGGGQNTASGTASFVGGGDQNVAQADWSTIGGGAGNQTQGIHSTIAGGASNTAGGDRSTVSGGDNNQALGINSTVGGGSSNQASGDNSTVGGGANNQASGNYSAVGGGTANQARGYAVTIAGGEANESIGSATHVAIGGGFQNQASGSAASIAGGVGNQAAGYAATIAGGLNNTASGYAATVGGGERDTASGNHATVGGGYNNTASGNYSVVGGGYSNTASSESTTVSGGGSNTARGNFATVGGGGSNTASAYGATVGGGVFNTASGPSATVGGGYNNTASDTAATVGGGAGNTASGYAATVAGGASNTASGNYSVVVGGSGNTANGQYNLVFGQNVVPNPTADYHVYLFGPGGAAPMGFLAMNRLAPVSAGNVIQVGTGNNNGNGASLTTGGIWTNASSRAFKDRFRPLAAQEVLMKIRSLPVEGWYYKGTEEYHIGPYAEDFYAAFGTGVREIIEMDSTGQLVRRPNPEVNKYLAASDVAGVALLGVKGVAEQVESVARQWGERLQAVEQDNQRLRQEVERLGQENEQLRARLQRLEELVEQLRQQCCVGGGQKGRAVEIHDAWLGQNIPNPFEGTTTIPYYIPSGVSRAELVVRDLGGRELRRVELPERGAHGQITLEMRLLGSGTYEYALVLDGRTVATRQMQLIK